MVTAALWVEAPGSAQGLGAQLPRAGPAVKGRGSLSQSLWELPGSLRGPGRALEITARVGRHFPGATWLLFGVSCKVETVVPTAGCCSWPPMAVDRSTPFFGDSFAEIKLTARAVGPLTAGTWWFSWLRGVSSAAVTAFSSPPKRNAVSASSHSPLPPSPQKPQIFLYAEICPIWTFHIKWKTPRFATSVAKADSETGSQGRPRNQSPNLPASGAFFLMRT